MQFCKTKEHGRIASAIKKRLKSRGIKGVRADDKEYNPDKFNNILTYMHGCGFGVAVIDKIKIDYFNPNVALEIGYMMALGKEVCLLKDNNIKELQRRISASLTSNQETTTTFGAGRAGLLAAFQAV